MLNNSCHPTSTPFHNLPAPDHKPGKSLGCSCSERKIQSCNHCRHPLPTRILPNRRQLRRSWRRCRGQSRQSSAGGSKNKSLAPLRYENQQKHSRTIIGVPWPEAVVLKTASSLAMWITFQDLHISKQAISSTPGQLPAAGHQTAPHSHCTRLCHQRGPNIGESGRTRQSEPWAVEDASCYKLQGRASHDDLAAQLQTQPGKVPCTCEHALTTQLRTHHDTCTVESMCAGCIASEMSVFK